MAPANCEKKYFFFRCGKETVYGLIQEMYKLGTKRRFLVHAILSLLALSWWLLILRTRVFFSRAQKSTFGAEMFARPVAVS